jgi:hypothetical protein
VLVQRAQGKKQNNRPPNRITTRERHHCAQATQRRARCIATARAATTLHNHTKNTRKNCTDAAPATNA